MHPRAVASAVHNAVNGGVDAFRECRPSSALNGAARPLGFQLNYNFVQLPLEIKWHMLVLADGFARVGTDVERRIQRDSEA